MTPNMFAEYRTLLPPGPAFIPCPAMYTDWFGRIILAVTSYYIWTPATEGTVAGWRRPTETEWSNMS